MAIALLFGIFVLLLAIGVPVAFSLAAASLVTLAWLGLPEVVLVQQIGAGIGTASLIAIPLFIQTLLIFWLGYAAARILKLSYADAAPAAMIGASNHFEVAIATATMLFGLSSGAALATVVGVLIEVPVMLWLVKICLRTQHWFPEKAS